MVDLALSLNVLSGPIAVSPILFHSAIAKGERGRASTVLEQKIEQEIVRSFTRSLGYERLTVRDRETEGAVTSWPLTLAPLQLPEQLDLEVVFQCCSKGLDVVL